MDDLTSFISARLDETELWAQAALEGWPDEFAGDVPREQAFAMHILADVKAKRAILALHYQVSDEYTDADGIERAAFICHECDNFGRSDNWPCPTVKHVAAIDSHHHDYRARWAV